MTHNLTRESLFKDSVKMGRIEMAEHSLRIWLQQRCRNWNLLKSDQNMNVLMKIKKMKVLSEWNENRMCSKHLAGYAASVKRKIRSMFQVKDDGLQSKLLIPEYLQREQHFLARNSFQNTPHRQCLSHKICIKTRLTNLWFVCCCVIYVTKEKQYQTKHL